MLPAPDGLGVLRAARSSLPETEFDLISYNPGP